MCVTRRIAPLTHPCSEIIAALSPNLSPTHTQSVIATGSVLSPWEVRCHRHQHLQLKQTFRDHTERETLFVLLLLFLFC